MKILTTALIVWMSVITYAWADACGTTDPFEERSFSFSYEVPDVEEFDLYEVELQVLEILPNPRFPGLLVIARIIGEDEIEALDEFDPDHMHIKWQVKGEDQWFTLEGFEYFALRQRCAGE